MNVQLLRACRRSLASGSRSLSFFVRRYENHQSQNASCNLCLTSDVKSNCLVSDTLTPLVLQTASFHTTKRILAFDEVEKGEKNCISLKELEEIVENDKVLLVDVRRPDEVEAGRIPAKRFLHIPVQEVVEAFQMSNSEFKSKYKMNKPDKDADDIIFHCKAGGRSTFALRMAQTIGYSKSRHFPGGWMEWSSKGA